MSNDNNAGLKLIFNDKCLHILPKKCLELELKINKDYDKEWVDLGDVLYAWSGTNYKGLCNQSVYKINKEQYEWISKNLNP